MVRPVDFTFNEQTATDNEFQHMPNERRPDEINRAALSEFQQSVDLLRSEGVNVIVLEADENRSAMKRPDAVFPNNWFSTHPDGTFVLYPMATPNRREEAKRHEELEQMLVDRGFGINSVVTVGRSNEDERFLEGTGSMVIDHVNRTVYAARSVRTNDRQMETFMKSGMARDFYDNCIMFDTTSSSGMPFYHTNVMMSIGKDFAVVCSECIVEADRKKVMDELRRVKRDVIDITLEQAEKFFCGNIIQLKNEQTGEGVVAMSESCLKGFTEEQLNTLRRHGRIAALPVSKTIEFVGGGSARCMIAEVFLPERAE
jgi:hypothetical protein